MVRMKLAAAEAAQWFADLQAKSQGAGDQQAALDEAISEVSLWAWNGQKPSRPCLCVQLGSPCEHTFEPRIAKQLQLLVRKVFLPPAETIEACEIDIRPDALVNRIPAGTIGGRTIIAAATRRAIELGEPVGVAAFAILAQLDASRIRTLVREKKLESTLPREDARPGRQVKGREVRITAASATAWLAQQKN